MKLIVFFRRTCAGNVRIFKVSGIHSFVFGRPLCDVRERDIFGRLWAFLHSGIIHLSYEQSNSSTG